MVQNLVNTFLEAPLNATGHGQISLGKENSTRAKKGPWPGWRNHGRKNPNYSLNRPCVVEGGLFGPQLWEATGAAREENLKVSSEQFLDQCNQYAGRTQPANYPNESCKDCILFFVESGPALFDRISLREHGRNKSQWVKQFTRSKGLLRACLMQGSKYSK